MHQRTAQQIKVTTSFLGEEGTQFQFMTATLAQCCNGSRPPKPPHICLNIVHIPGLSGCPDLGPLPAVSF